MEQTIAPKEVRILETAEDIQERRDQVLSRYSQFKCDARSKRDKLEDSRRFQYFKRDADELESWIFEKLQAASDESYRDPTNLQAKIQKHQAFEAEVAAHSNAIVSLDNTGHEMINEGHFAADVIQKRLEELHRLWELLLSRLADKGMKLQQALVLVQFLRQCDEVMFWISDKVNWQSTICDTNKVFEEIGWILRVTIVVRNEISYQLLRNAYRTSNIINGNWIDFVWIYSSLQEAFVSSDEFGSDLEHVEVLQRKFDEFQKDMAAQEFRVTEVLELADRLVTDGHPEEETIIRRKEVSLNLWSISVKFNLK